jgi:2-dehydropantoate 2-reductase
MRYIIYGAGGVGGAIGGLLHAAGQEAVLICRGAQLTAVQARGLTVRTPAGPVQAAVPAVGHPREIRFGDGDVVILTMKAQDTEAALRELEAAGGGNLPIICGQNGVENERIAARRFERVYAMLIAMPATYLEPGFVTAWGTPVFGVLDSGRYPAGVDPLIEHVAADLTAAGFSCRADPAIMRMKYAKLLDNLGNALQALADAPRGDPRVRQILDALRAEGVACYEAAGIDWMPQSEYRAIVGPRTRTGEIPGEKRAGNSTWQSLARGLGTIETDYLNGEIVLLGALHGVPTPCNAILRRLAQRMVVDGRPPGSLGIDAVVEALPVSTLRG